MNADNQHLFVIRSVEDADLPSLRKPARRAPQKVVLEFVRARLSEARNLAALGIDAGHDVPDRPILPGRVHPLKRQQQRIAVRCVQQALLIA